MIVALVVALIFLVPGVILLAYAPALVERSKRPGSRWVIPEGQRLPVLRGMGAVYTLIGLLLVYGAVRAGS